MTSPIVGVSGSDRIRVSATARIGASERHQADCGFPGGDPGGRTLLAAIDTVAAGGSVIDPDVVGVLVDQTARRLESPVGKLTTRERDVLHHMAQGRTNAGVAAELNLSESSVEKYATSIFAKLSLTDEPLVHRRVAAVLTYLHQSGQAGPL